jgi:hypothetical protein
MTCKKDGIFRGIKGFLCAHSRRFVLFPFLSACVLVPVFTSVARCASQTELGSAGDLVVLGTGGTELDPNTKIKGFTVFGSTQAAYTGAVVGDGNVVVNGALSVSSGAYFVGNSTFTGASKIFVNDGSPGQILTKNSGGWLDWVNSNTLGDNLGSHVATTTLNMASWNIVNVSSVNFLPNVFVASATAAQGGGVYVSTNLFVVGYSSAVKYFGDGSSLTGITGVADNLGDHIATQNIQLNNHWLSNDGGAEGVRVSDTGNVGISSAAPAYRLVISSGAGEAGNMLVISTGTSNVIRMTGAGEIYAAKFYGDVSGAGGLPAADNLGDHTATKNLNMSSYDIVNVSTLTVSSITSLGAGVVFSTNVLVMNGNVGIGTALPGAALDINGNVLLSGGGSEIEFNSGGPRLRLPAANTLAFHTGGGFGSATLERMRIDSAGNIGIGSVSPGTSRLWVQGGAAEDYHLRVSSQDATGALFVVDNAGGVGAGTAFPRNTFEAKDLIYFSTYTHSTHLGYQAGHVNIGDSNNFNGYKSGYSNTTGANNNFMGAFAGYSNIDGYPNNFVGALAGYYNTSGGSNNFIGYMAGYQNTASFNNFVGILAGQSNTSGANNNFVGYQAGQANGAASGNNFVGSLAGQANVTGAAENFIGYSAGYSNVSGSYNNFIGANAGYYNVAGGSNTVIGYQAGYGVPLKSYEGNSIMGYNAGSALSSGSRNTLLGWQAGDSLSTGSDNIIIGYNADAPAADSNNHLNIGGALYGDLTNGNIGISSTTPAYRLVISSGAGEAGNMLVISTGSSNVIRMTGAGEIFANKFYGDGSAITGLTGLADNLGNHTATKDLQMSGFQITNAGAITASSVTATGAGISAAQLRLAAGVAVSSETDASLGGGVRVSTNIYVVGFSSAAKYYGDGSSLTGLTGLADNLGNHTATKDLNMAGYQILAVSSMAITGRVGIGTASPVAQLQISTVAGAAGNMLVLSTGTSDVIRMTGAGEIYATKFYGDVSSAQGLPVSDNLGNHTATKDLQMSGFQILNVGSVTVVSPSGVGTPQVVFAANRTISSETVSGRGGGITVSTNVYIIGFASATKYFGDGTGLTGISGDNLGNHTASMALNMNTNPIINISSLTVIAGTSQAASVWISTSLVTPHLYISTMGYVGIGTASPGANLTVAGGINATAFYYNSDAAFKKEITPLNNSLDDILKLSGVSFKWKDSGQPAIGLVAQDVEKVYPELVTTNPQTGMKSVQYGNLVAPLIEAIKAQQAQIDALKKEIEALKTGK